MKRLGWLVVPCLLAVLGFGQAEAGSRVVREFVLFGGSNTDSTEQASTWIPVFGASRVYIRTWTSKAAFHASTDADSTYSDSLTTFKLVFSDSLTSNKLGADSIIVDPVATTRDTAKTCVVANGIPINKELRGAANGSGLITTIAPSVVVMSSATAVSGDANGMIVKKYLRIRVTPLRRFTVSGFSSTSGNRVNGLKGLRMRAYVVYDNQ